MYWLGFLKTLETKCFTTSLIITEYDKKKQNLRLAEEKNLRLAEEKKQVGKFYDDKPYQTKLKSQSKFKQDEVKKEKVAILNDKQKHEHVKQIKQ